MRKELIRCEAIAECMKANKCGFNEALENIAPWACKFESVCDGYIAFESWDEYQPWSKQL